MRPVMILMAVLIGVCNLLLLWRLSQDGLDLVQYRPQLRYEVSLQMSADLVGDPAVIRAYLPQTDAHQKVVREWSEATGLSYEPIIQDGDIQGRFTTQGGLIGHHQVSYHAIVEISEEQYRLDPDTHLPSSLPADISRYLLPEELIQSDHQEIIAAAHQARSLIASETVVSTIQACFNYVHTTIENSEYENSLDALMTLRWGEGYCGGKSRLLTAMLRASGVPTRLVGGVILEPGIKRIGHVWCEAWVNGEWLPLDPVNGHFQFKPAHYLVLYHGDKSLTSRSQDINFKYNFHIREHSTPPEQAMIASPQSVPAYPVWSFFKDAGMPLEMLRILMMLPIAVLIVIIGRNIIGLPSFGTFVPALLALAFGATGLTWGLLLLAVVLLVGILARSMVDRLQLLHTPRLALVLAVVVGTILAICFLAIGRGWVDAGNLALFPVIIIVCMVEQCYTSMQESGTKHTLATVLGTAIVVSSVYLVITWPPLQTLVLVLPEVLLVVIALYLAIGRYVGLRLGELIRFRDLLFSSSKVGHGVEKDLADGERA